MANDEPASPSDHSLLRRYRGGSQDAATQLYLRYARRLQGLARAQISPELARRVDVDDVVQSAFGSFFRRAGSGFYDAPVGDDLWRLFLVIALHKVRGQGAFHRAARRDVRRTQGLAAGTGEGEWEAEADTASYAFLDLAVREALGRLLPAHRQMVELRVAGHTVEEIACQTARSKRTVERLLREARERLGELLEEDH